MKKVFVCMFGILAVTTSVFAQTKAGKQDITQNQITYTCPMHPEVLAHQPGKCPKCGMELNLSPKEQMKAGALKNYTCPAHLDVASHDPGKCPKCGKKLSLSTKEQMKAEIAKVYTCPMHPSVALDKEGNCPKCGTALVVKKQD